MAVVLVLEPGEVQTLPPAPHTATTPLVARTDEEIGSGEELLIITPGKKGLKLIPWGSVFHDYAPFTNIPIFELPDKTLTTWHTENEEATKE